MEGVCPDCGRNGRLHARGRCTPCYWRAKHDAEKQPCPGCARRAKLRETSAGPRCWRCIRREAPRKQPTPRPCGRCGELRRHSAHGLCGRCLHQDPLTVSVWVQGATERLGPRCPAWFGAFAEHLLERGAPAVCLRHLRRVERALCAGHGRPASLVEAVRDGGRSGRSPGDTARHLEAFLVARGLMLASDEQGRLAAGRRARRLKRCPEPLRPGLECYLAALLRSNQRAKRRGERPLSDHTVEQRLAALARFAQHLHALHLDDWAAVSRTHVEAFLTTARDSGARLAALRDFFRFARRERLALADPTAELRRKPAPGFAGRTLSPRAQAELLRRFASAKSHPTEALVGLLSLLHGASARELRELNVEDLDSAGGTLRLGRRRHPVPLDPLSASAIERCLAHRQELGTHNPHLIVTRSTRAHRTPASQAYLSHVLDSAGVSPRLLRQTRLADLAHRLDPRLVADAFGITAEAALHYLVGSVDAEHHNFANP